MLGGAWSGLLRAPGVSQVSWISCVSGVSILGLGSGRPSVVVVVFPRSPLASLAIISSKGSVVARGASILRRATVVSVLVQWASMLDGNGPCAVPGGCGRAVRVGEAFAARGRLIIGVGLWHSGLASVGSLTLRASGGC